MNAQYLKSRQESGSGRRGSWLQDRVVGACYNGIARADLTRSQACLKQSDWPMFSPLCSVRFLYRSEGMCIRLYVDKKPLFTQGFVTSNSSGSRHPPVTQTLGCYDHQVLLCATGMSPYIYSKVVECNLSRRLTIPFDHGMKCPHQSTGILIVVGKRAAIDRDQRRKFPVTLEQKPTAIRRVFGRRCPFFARGPQ